MPRRRWASVSSRMPRQVVVLQISHLEKASEGCLEGAIDEGVAEPTLQQKDPVWCQGHLGHPAFLIRRCTSSSSSRVSWPSIIA